MSRGDPEVEGFRAADALSREAGISWTRAHILVKGGFRTLEDAGRISILEVGRWWGIGRTTIKAIIGACDAAGVPVLADWRAW